MMLLDDFMQEFGDCNAAISAQHWLDTTLQGCRFVAQFNNDWLAKVEEAGYTDTLLLISRYLGHLCKPVQDAILALDMMPAGLDKTMSAALDWEANLIQKTGLILVVQNLQGGILSAYHSNPTTPNTPSLSNAMSSSSNTISCFVNLTLPKIPKDVTDMDLVAAMSKLFVLTKGDDTLHSKMLANRICLICRISTSDGTCESDRYDGHTADSHVQRGEEGRDGFSQWRPVGATEPPAPPSCLCMDSTCKGTYPDIPCSFLNPNTCPTTKHLGPTPWVLSSGEKQLDLHTTVAIPCDPSFPLKMLVNSGFSGSLIDKHLVNKLGILKIKLACPRLLLNADHSKNEWITHVICLDVHIGSIQDSVIFAIANLGKAGIFLGFAWLECLNLSSTGDDDGLPFLSL